MLKIILIFILGGMAGIILMSLLFVSKNSSLIHPDQLELEVKHGLKGKKPFFIASTNIHITPWKDGSGVIRVGKED